MRWVVWLFLYLSYADYSSSPKFSRVEYGHPRIVAASFVADDCIAAETGKLCTNSYLAERYSKTNIIHLCGHLDDKEIKNLTHGDGFTVIFNYPLLSHTVSPTGEQFRIMVYDQSGYRYENPLCAFPGPFSKRRDSYSVTLLFPGSTASTNITKGVPLKIEVRKDAELQLMGANGAHIPADSLELSSDDLSFSFKGEVHDVLSLQTPNVLRFAKLFPHSLRDAGGDSPSHCGVLFPHTQHVLRLIFVDYPTVDGINPVDSKNIDLVHIMKVDGNRWQSDEIFGIASAPKTKDSLQRLRDADNLIDICLGTLDKDIVSVYLPCQPHSHISSPKGGPCFEHVATITGAVEVTGFDNLNWDDNKRTIEFQPAMQDPEKIQACQQGSSCFGVSEGKTNGVFYMKFDDKGWCEKPALWQSWFKVGNRQQDACPAGELSCSDLTRGLEFRKNDFQKNLNTTVLGCGAAKWCQSPMGGYSQATQESSDDLSDLQILLLLVGSVTVCCMVFVISGTCTKARQRRDYVPFCSAETGCCWGNCCAKSEEQEPFLEKKGCCDWLCGGNDDEYEKEDVESQILESQNPANNNDQDTSDYGRDSDEGEHSIDYDAFS